MLYLLIALAALALGPLTLDQLRQRPALGDGIDSFVLVSITGLVFLHFVPQALKEKSYDVLAALLAGFLLPLVLERFSRRAEGPDVTVLRLVTGATAALLVGWLVGGRLVALPTPNEHGEENQSGETLGSRFRLAITTGTGEVVDHTAPWILLGLAVTAGVLVDWVFPSLRVPTLSELTQSEPSDLQIACLLGLMLLFGASLARRGVRRFAGKISAGLGWDHDHHDHGHGHHHHDHGHAHS